MFSMTGLDVYRDEQNLPGFLNHHIMEKRVVQNRNLTCKLPTQTLWSLLTIAIKAGFLRFTIPRVTI